MSKGSNERIINITGSPKQIQTAQFLLKQLIKELAGLTVGTPFQGDKEAKSFKTTIEGIDAGEELNKDAQSENGNKETTSKHKRFLLKIKCRKESQIEGTNGKQMKIDPYDQILARLRERKVARDQISAKNETTTTSSVNLRTKIP